MGLSIFVHNLIFKECFLLVLIILLEYISTEFVYIYIYIYVYYTYTERNINLESLTHGSFICIVVRACTALNRTMHHAFSVFCRNIESLQHCSHAEWTFHAFLVSESAIEEIHNLVKGESMLSNFLVVY